MRIDGNRKNKKTKQCRSSRYPNPLETTSNSARIEEAIQLFSHFPLPPTPTPTRAMDKGWERKNTTTCPRPSADLTGHAAVARSAVICGRERTNTKSRITNSELRACGLNTLLPLPSSCGNVTSPRFLVELHHSKKKNDWWKNRRSEGSKTSVGTKNEEEGRKKWRGSEKTS